jgi:hypothetical protein
VIIPPEWILIQVGNELSYARINMKAKAFELRVDVQKIASFSRVVKCQNSSKSHPFQELEKHPNFQVTCCFHFDTTDADFA